MAEQTRHDGITKLGENTYRIRATIVDRGKRREVDRVREGITLRGALRLQAEWREALRAGEGRRQRMRLRDFAASWLASRLPRLKHSTRKGYAKVLDLRVLPALGDFYVADLAHDDLQTFVNAQGGSAGNVWRVLRAMLRDAVVDLDLPRDPTTRVRVPARRVYDDANPNVLTADELGRVLDALRAQSPQWYPLAATCAWTGLRYGEVTALRWEDVDEAAGLIRVRRAQSDGHVDTTKTDTRRSVPLVPELAAVLRDHRRAMLADQHPGVDAGWVFPSRAGSLRRYGVLRKPLARALAAAGVAHKLSVHGFRRTFNNLARQVTSGEVVRAITGHVTERMTEHYSHVDAREKQAAAAAVLRLVRGGSTPGAAPLPAEVGGDRGGDRVASVGAAGPKP